MCLTDAVGDGGANAKVDVALVQVLINLNADRMPPNFQQLAEDGLIGSKTIDAIQTFQRHVLEQAAATGELDSDGPTLEALQRGVPADWSPRTLKGIMPLTSEALIGKYSSIIDRRMGTHGVTAAGPLPAAAFSVHRNGNLKRDPPLLNCRGHRDAAGWSRATRGHVPMSAIAVAPPVACGMPGCVWRP